MKRILSALFLSGLLSIQAATVSFTVTNGGFTNSSLMLGGPVKVTQIIVASSTTNQIASLQFIDTPTNSLTYTNAAYTNITSGLTNIITLWTNYMGVTNTFTNISLIETTNTVAANTNSYPVRIAVNIGTNSTLKMDQVNYYFAQGFWVTNSAAVASNSGPATVTVTFQQ